LRKVRALNKKLPSCLPGKDALARSGYRHI
jgi:hypothetical protein